MAYKLRNGLTVTDQGDKQYLDVIFNSETVITCPSFNVHQVSKGSVNLFGPQCPFTFHKYPSNLIIK